MMPACASIVCIVLHRDNAPMNDILFALLSCSVAILDVPESSRRAAHFLCVRFSCSECFREWKQQYLPKDNIQPGHFVLSCQASGETNNKNVTQCH